MLKLPRIIGFSGLAGSGKTTVAQAFADTHGYTRISFAEPLKQMLAVLVPADAEKTEERPELCGKTVRYALQSLGTEWGRKMIGDTVWVDALIRRLTSGGKFVIDDVRFPNEAQVLLDWGVTIVRVHRCGVAAMDHDSERGIPDELVNIDLSNSGSLEQTLEDLEHALSQWPKN
jgi:hypothetical protein